MAEMAEGVKRVFTGLWVVILLIDWFLVWSMEYHQSLIFLGKW